MNGIHDMGGMHGLGPVQIERDEPVFHAEWERRVFALNIAAGYAVKWNIDMSRYAKEQMPAAEYLATGYYDHWLWGLEKLLVDAGAVTAEELATGRARTKAAGAAPLRAAGVSTFVHDPKPGARVDADVAPLFKPGDRVRTHNDHPVGHTRLPRYARGKHGVVDRDHGVFVFPDTNAMTRDKKPQHCYAVRFSAQELWGPAASPRDSVYVDLWDDHLDPA
jgi:nitrile hydratase subunit beta